MPITPPPENPEESRRRAIARAKKRRKLATKKKVNNADTKESETQKLLSWRTDRFQFDCGMSRAQARKWADSDADWHELELMVRDRDKGGKGIPLKIAMRILKSLD